MSIPNRSSENNFKLSTNDQVTTGAEAPCKTSASHPEEKPHSEMGKLKH
jgi:hypothetical protein